MADIDLGEATDWAEGDTHGRISLQPNKEFNTPTQSAPAEKDVVISSPLSIELSVNTNHSTDQQGDKVIFTTYHGDQKRTIAVLDSQGNLYIAGRVFEGQTNLLTMYT
ncbi:DUF6342 family protein [Saccharothrix sp. Mg75]|uniref:DUF6342 family protein n=1 Tax=Saccharothrix sp. Mg75 TaxID=3445357 RepID=UPI003EED29A4